MIATRKNTPNVATSSRLCPNGCGHLTPFTSGSTTVERCATCAGIYLDKQMVDRMRRMPHQQLVSIDDAVVPSSRAASAEARRRVDPRPCPNCRTLMLPYEVACRVPVTLDKCGSCDGIWADDRELEAASVKDPDSEVHFGQYVSVSARDEMVKALYDESGPHLNSDPREGAFAELFPTFASWVRKAPEEAHS